ncbi:MAG: hypothetical protein ABI645_12525 [Pseudomonadota bacterium]
MSNAPLRASHGQDRIVMFADLLGFAALVEQHPLDTQHLGGNDRLDSMFAGVFSDRNPLTHAFTTFHRSLRWTLQIEQMQYSATAISFSDSAFVATARLCEAVAIASRLMNSVLRSGVAMRVGIACGTFEAVQFRSDISLYGGDHAAQFLGTGVVRAHATESCGIKGCRILLHPSATALLGDQAHNPGSGKEHFLTLPCAQEELQNKAGVQDEVNYWPTARKEDEDAWRGVQELWDAAPKREHVHYRATAQAANNMRVAKGQPAVTDFRRRTVPRLRRTSI